MTKPMHILTGISFSVILAATTLTAQTAQHESQTEPHANGMPSEPQPPDWDAHFFAIDFVLEEREGKQVLSRKTMQVEVATRNSARFRSGDRTWYDRMDKGQKQTEYETLGLSIDINNAFLEGDGVALDIRTEIQSIPDNQSPHANPNEIVRNYSASSRLYLPFGKTTQVVALDEIEGNRTIVLSATPKLVR